MKAILLVSIGGFFGSGIRYIISGIWPQMKGFPLGTLLVNIIASFILGLILGLNFYRDFFSKNMRLLLATGFCGGFSTYSTFAYESMRLIQNKQIFLVFLNLFLNTFLSISFAFLGFYISFILSKTFLR